MMKALKNNRLVSHPAYGKIIMQYNERLASDGKVNNKKFYEQIVRKEIPSYSMQAWYNFIKRFKTEAGLQAVEPVQFAGGNNKESNVTESVDAMGKILQTNSIATSNGINLAINLGSKKLQEILENPQLMSAKDTIDLLFKAMKAQDSRLHAIGKVREDNREELKMERAFANGAYE